MSGIIDAVFNTSIGWLLNKGRDIIAETLLEGDVTNKKIRDLIVRELEDIKSKLDGLSEKDLWAALDFFETGLRFLFKALEVNPNGQASFVTAETSVGVTSKSLNVFSLADTAKTVSVAVDRIEKNNSPETTNNAFDEARERFKMARERATDASNNKSLGIFDRITAIRYRVMAAMLESVIKSIERADTAGDMSCLSVEIVLENALPECEQCLQRLHSLPAVQSTFKVALEKGLLSRINRDERTEMIVMVCQVNSAIFNAKQAVGKDTRIWPCVDIGEDKVDPLRDGRISELMRSVNMEHFCVKPRSFGQSGGEKHKLKFPYGIATNIPGYFFIIDENKTVKVFNSNGVFHSSFIPKTADSGRKVYSHIRDVAITDVDNKIYLLVDLKKSGVEEWQGEVQVYNYHKTADLQHTFPVQRGGWGLAVSGKSTVLVLVDNVVYVYDQKGHFLWPIGENLFRDASDVATTRDGRVAIVDGEDSCVYIFNMEGIQLAKFKMSEGVRYYRMACHPLGHYVAIAGLERKTRRLILTLYTLKEKLVSNIYMQEKNIYSIAGITAAAKGHIAVALRSDTTSKVIVVC